MPKHFRIPTQFHHTALMVALLGTSLAHAAIPPAQIAIPGEKIFPESLTSAGNGSVIIGSIGARTIWRASPGSSTAEAWIKPGTDDMQSIFGVFADPKSNTLWACSNASGPPGSVPASSALYRFDLKTGSPRGHYAMPTAGALCNDIAIDAQGNVYATDSLNMQVARLAKGAQTLEVWAGADSGFGAKGGVLDGIAVLGNRVVVNTLGTGKLFSVPIQKDGKAGSVAEIQLDRTVERPDGMRSFGKSSLLLVESGSVGRLLKVALNESSGTVTVVKEGFPSGPVAVTVVSTTAYVLEGQLAARRDPNIALKPFEATAVPVGKPAR
jgi:hypothetical protein